MSNQLLKHKLIRNKLRMKIWEFCNKRILVSINKGETSFGYNFYYKIWKHYTKILMNKNLVDVNPQDILDANQLYLMNKDLLKYIFLPERKRNAVISSKKEESVVQITPSEYNNFIAVQGFYYSGSSAVIGLFQEFNNTTILGYPDYTYSTGKAAKGGKEVRFFIDSSLFPLIDSFYNGSLLEQDLLIKKFINNVYNCYKNKGLYSWDQNPEIYNDEFFRKSLSFIYSIVELDDYTVDVCKKAKMPTSFCSTDTKFKDCTFMHGQGLSAYVLYKFRKMTPESFKTQVSNYISDFFSHLQSKDFLVCDQIFGGKYLDNYNKYAKIPAKQICVYRDPRDQFLSAFRADGTGNMPRTIDKFVDFYKVRYNFENLLREENPNRLIIRFEDLVLKYDETVQRIIDFVGIDAACHFNKKSIFDPAISAQNIGAYRNFVDQEFMKQIEERLSEYCYYPEKENLSEESWKILRENNFKNDEVKNG